MQPPTTTPVPGGSARFSFEDGATQGWRVGWGSNVSVANTTSVAFDGKRALALRVAGRGYPGIETRSGLAGLNGGMTVTFHIFSPPNNGGIVVTPYAFDDRWNFYHGGDTALAPGWNTVTWQLPAMTGVKGLGFQINNWRNWRGRLALDAVSW
jgi:hypothetical protein